jgi:deoxyadenosine/deoxycytidine kinase
MRSIITVIGNVAVGKSTILPYVVDATQGTAVMADDFFQVSPFRDRFIADIPRWALPNELFLLLKRVELMESLLLEQGSSPLIVDSGIPMSWIYMRSHAINGLISNEEWDIFQSIFARVTRPLFTTNHTILHLSAGIPILMERIHKRGRDYELAHYKESYLEQLEKGIEAFLHTSIAQQARYVTIPTETTAPLIAEDKKEAVLKLLSESLR